MSDVRTKRVSETGFSVEDMGDTHQLISRARVEQARLDAVVHTRRNEMRIFAAFGGIVMSACLAALATIAVNAFGHYHAFSEDAQTQVAVVSIFIGLVAVFMTVNGMLEANANLGTALGMYTSLGMSIADAEEDIGTVSRKAVS